MTLTVDKRFQFLVGKRHKLSDATLRRLISFGMHFVVISIEKCMKDGKILEEQDVITIMSDVDNHGMWTFRRAVIEDILDESRP